MDLKDILALVEKVSGKYKTKADKVVWSAWKEDGSEVGKWTYGSCYSPGMRCLPELEIHCLPKGGALTGLRQMPALWYHHFFRLLKQNGLVPPEVKTLHRKGAHCMIIPRTGWDRHTLYITLCYYRQVDQKPNEIMKAMLLYKRLAPRGTHFLQVMHYLAATTQFGSGHYFMNFGAYGGADKLDLANGLALAEWARKTKAQRAKACPYKPGEYSRYSAYTNDYMSAQAKKLKSVKVEDLVEILNPKYAHLYTGEPEPDGN
jgi:hypothetical protein